MHEIVFLGLKGQGLKMALEVLAAALVKEQKYVLAYPEGTERMRCSLRFAENPFRNRSAIERPEVIILFDLSMEKLIPPLQKNGVMIANAPQWKKGHFVDASSIAKNILKQPFPNMVLLGAFAHLTKLVHLSSLEAAVKERFIESVANANITCLREGTEKVQ